MQFTPLGDRLLIRATQTEEKTQGGIFLAPNAVNTAPTTGVILAAGPGRYDNNGQLIPMQAKVGDIVLWGKFAGGFVEVNGEQLLLVHEGELVGIIGHQDISNEPISTGPFTTQSCRSCCPDGTCNCCLDAAKEGKS